MLHTTTLQKVLLISLLVLLSTSQAGSVSAGTDGWTGAGPESGEALAVRTYLPLPLSRPPSKCDGVSEIPRPECEALVSLYNSTNGPGWAHRDGWLATNTPCSWYGVKCEARHVQELDLSANRLSGAIPPSLGNLANLQTLGLAYNQLSGAIPHELGNLANLRELCLGGNRLSDAIPPELGNLANLQVLCLGGNRLSGAIPPELGNLAELQGLFLNDNPLSGALPRSLMNLNLISFYFNNTHLCEPPDATFQAWLAGIYDLRRTGVVCSYAYLPLCSH